jgi:hypothetical protein
VRAAIGGFDTIDAVSDEFREMVAEQAPELLAKLPPRKPPAPSISRPARARRSKPGLRQKRI